MKLKDFIENFASQFEETDASAITAETNGHRCWLCRLSR